MVGVTREQWLGVLQLSTKQLVEIQLLGERGGEESKWPSYLWKPIAPDKYHP